MHIKHSGRRDEQAIGYIGLEFREEVQAKPKNLRFISVQMIFEATREVSVYKKKVQGLLDVRTQKSEKEAEEDLLKLETIPEEGRFQK